MNTIQQYSKGCNDVINDESYKYLKGNNNNNSNSNNDLRLDIPELQYNMNRVNSRVLQRAEEQRRYIESLQQYSGRSDGSKFADFSNNINNNNNTYTTNTTTTTTGSNSHSPFDRLNKSNSNSGQTSARSNINAPIGLFATLGANDRSMIPITERRANQIKYSQMLNESASSLPLMKTYTKLEKSRPYTPSDPTKSIGNGVLEDLNQRYQPKTLDSNTLEKIEKQKEYVNQLHNDEERKRLEYELQYDKDVRNGVIPKHEYNNFGETLKQQQQQYHQYNDNNDQEEYYNKINKQYNYSNQLDLDKEIARQQESLQQLQYSRNSGTLKIKELQSLNNDNNNKQNFVIGKHPEELKQQQEQQKKEYRQQLDKQKEVNEITIRNNEQENNKRYYLNQDDNKLPYENKATPTIDRHNYNQQRQLMMQENFKLQQYQQQQEQQYKEEQLQQQYQQQQQLLQQQRMEQDYIKTNSQRYVNPFEQEEKEKRQQEILKQQQLYNEITIAANAKPIPTERVSLYNKYKKDDDGKNYQGSFVVGGRSYYVDPEEARQRKIQLQHEYSRQIAESANSKVIENSRKPFIHKSQEVNDYNNTGRSVQLPNPVLSGRSELPQFNTLMANLTLPKVYQQGSY